VFALNLSFPPLAGFSFSRGRYMIIHIAVVSLWAEDVPATAHFYRDAIGLNIMPRNEGDRLHF
jgi:hypothetical protein